MKVSGPPQISINDISERPYSVVVKIMDFGVKQTQG